MAVKLDVRRCDEDTGRVYGIYARCWMGLRECRVF